MKHTLLPGNVTENYILNEIVSETDFISYEKEIWQLAHNNILSLLIMKHGKYEKFIRFGKNFEV